MILSNYKTSDIVLAAVLKIHGFKLVDVIMHGKKGTFHFVQVDDDIINRFNFDGMMIEPKCLHSQIRDLSTLIRRMVETNG